MGAGVSVVDVEEHDVDQIDKETGQPTGKKVHVAAETIVNGIFVDDLDGVADVRQVSLFLQTNCT